MDELALVEIEVSEERRAQMAVKGRRLYAKYCGLHGEGICAESFAEYHIRRGELVVARDFLSYLDTVITDLEAQPVTPPTLVMTRRLSQRIRALMGE